MNKRNIFLVVLSVALISFGMPGTGAAQKENLPESYVWATYGIGVNYPAGWTVTEEQTRISIHPADRAVNDGQGPEFVLFALPDTTAADLDVAIQPYVGSVAGAASPVIETTLAGYPARSFTFDQTTPDTIGSLTLAAVNNNVALGAAYIVRDSEADLYLPVLESMFDTLNFPGTARDDGSTSETVTFASRDVASVQLPQLYDWKAAGLTFYYPSDWSVSLDKDIETGEVAVNLLPNLSADGLLIQATTFESVPGVDLHQAIALLGEEVDIERMTDLTVAGYPAVIYEITDYVSSVQVRMVGVAIDVQDMGVVATFIFGSDESSWDAFRPMVYAFIGSIERMDGQLSSLGIGDALRSHISVVPRGMTLQVRRQGGSTDYTSEEYGISAELPEGWEALDAGSDWDIAFVSPEAMAGNAGGFITIQIIPSLGTMTLDTALDAVAEEVGGEDQPVTFAGQDAREVDFSDAETGAAGHLILAPYGTDGTMLYIQASAPDQQSDEAVQGVLSTITIEPVVLDKDAVNAAWQSSLADEGKLLFGAADAPVRMIELFDFTCGHCATYSREVGRLAALEGDAGRLQIQWLIGDWIGGELAKNALMTTYCATEQGKGYTVYETLFGAYLGGGDPSEVYSRDGINDLLNTDEFGLDMDALNACVDDGKYESALSDAETLWDQVGATGTPTILLSVNGSDPEFIAMPDGQPWPGGVPISVLREKVEAAINGEAVTTTKSE